MRIGKAPQPEKRLRAKLSLGLGYRLGLGLCVGFCLGLALPNSLAASTDEPLTAQERLEAIRQGLVEATLQTPTKVTTTSWIDAQGSLRESSSFKNGMVVKGVRVLAYGRDESGQAKARLQTSPVNATESNKGQSQAPASEADCAQKVGAQLSPVVRLDLDVAPTAHPMVLQFLLPQIQALWVNSAGNGNPLAKAPKPWRAVNNLPPASMANSLSAYERALVSPHTQDFPWQASVRIRTQPTPARGFEGYPGYRAPGVALDLEFQMGSQDGQSIVIEDTLSLVLEIERPSWGAPRISNASAQAVQEQLQDWRAQSEQWLQCQHLNPVVTSVTGQQIQINAGSLAGVRKGDEWLVANPARFPAELAGKDGAPQTLLAKVQAVTPYHSQLVVLAGPVQAVQAEWRAWPTETLIKEPKLINAPNRANAPVKRPAKPVASATSHLGFPVN